MRGTRTPVSHSQPRPCSGRKTLKKCRNNGEADNIVLIDVDSDGFNNVIVIDVPESLQKKLRGPSGLRKDKRCPLSSVICIDDDESADNSHPGTSGKDDDELQFDEENLSPLRLSKCKRTYSGKGSTRNRYGLDHVSESGSSDNDCLDCEFMEDSVGELRELWERASLKRKHYSCNGKSGFADNSSASNLHNDINPNIGVDNKAEAHAEAPVCSSSSEETHEKKGRSPSIASCNGNLGRNSNHIKKNMDDSFEELRQLWERASLKGKLYTHHGQSGFADNSSASSLHNDINPNVGGDNNAEAHTEAPVSSCSSEETCEKKDRSPSIPTCNGKLGSSSYYINKTKFSDYLLKSMLKTRFPLAKDNVTGRVDPLSEADFLSKFGPSFTKNSSSFTSDLMGGSGDSCNHSEKQTDQHFEQDGSTFCSKEEQSSQGRRLSSSHEQDTEKVNQMEKEFQNKKKTLPAEPCLSKSVSSGGVDSCQNNSIFPDEATMCQDQGLGDTDVDNSMSVFRNKDEAFRPARSYCRSHFVNESNNGNSFEEKLVSGESSPLSSQPSDKTQVNLCGSPEDKIKTVLAETFFCRNISSGKSEISIERGCHQENGKSVTGSSNLNEAQPKHGKSCSIEAEEVQIESNDQQDDKRDTLVQEPDGDATHTVEAQPKHVKPCSIEAEEVQIESNDQQDDKRDTLVQGPDGDATYTVENCFINEREKLKETDEYKRAVEEEWASRQRALQIQAEEAQHLRRLRKRRKAESMRLLDMERRQKQRVEEMRETQKKDVENMNMKEQLRAEVRRELHMLEITCCDMASVLRGLGVNVGIGLDPSSPEVRAAYKRALLTFHPDRASRSDLRQQVESEEKFKLISRMKEKFLFNS